jgi:hypothetical protein
LFEISFSRSLFRVTSAQISGCTLVMAKTTIQPQQK